MLHTEGSDKLLIAWLITVLAQDAQRSLTLVKSLSTLAQTTAQAIGNKSLLENLLNGGIDIHRSGRSRSGGGSNIISLYIRHVEFLDELSLSEVNQANISLVSLEGDDVAVAPAPAPSGPMDI